ncbi:MAG TPA: phosphate ABC transporter substrate-binding protein [Usitatibacter sp.]|nr:phosphate ABC transporter substrate-binding protein [Usitatibacter sp.]
MKIRRILAFQILGLMAAWGWPAHAQEVVAVVSARSPVTALNAGQVADIFLGKTSRFPDGSQAVPIDLVEDSPARDRFYAQYAGKSPAQVKAHWSKIIFTGRGQPPRQANSPSEVKKIIADNPNAIGYIDQSQVDNSLRVLAGR